MERPQAPPPSGGAGPNFGPPPKRDMVVTDGQKLTLGDVAVTLVITPGHTPGTLSFIIPVKDKGQPHVVAMWGGTGLPNKKAALEQYISSTDHFSAAARAAKVDAELSNHPFVDDSLTRMALVRADPSKPNPFVIGAARYADYEAIIKHCAMASRPTATP